MLAWALWGNQVLKPLYCLLSWLWVAKFNYSTIHCGLNVLIEVHQHCLSSRGRIPINLFIQIPDPMIWHMGCVALSLPSSILHTAEDRPMPVTSELSDVCSVMDTEQATPNLKLHLLPWAGKESAKGMRKEQMNQGQNWYFLLLSLKFHSVSWNEIMKSGALNHPMKFLFLLCGVNWGLLIWPGRLESVLTWPTKLLSSQNVMHVHPISASCWVSPAGIGLGGMICQGQEALVHLARFALRASDL